MITFDFNTVAQGVTVTLLCGGVYGVFGIYRSLLKMNGTIKEIKEWQDGHEALDNTRFEEFTHRMNREDTQSWRILLERFDALEEKIAALYRGT